jgi:WXG100 family type VII secretion target
MADEMKMVYESVEAMVKTFDQSVEQLQDTMQEMQSIAGVLEDGALLGDGGQAFVEAIRNTFARSMTKLTEKMEELSGDCQAAIEEFQAADSESAGMF